MIFANYTKKNNRIYVFFCATPERETIMAVMLTEFFLMVIVLSVVIFIFYSVKHSFAIYSAADGYKNERATDDKQSNIVLPEINSSKRFFFFYIIKNCL